VIESLLPTPGVTTEHTRMAKKTEELADGRMKRKDYEK
jgi:hypothetical protein